MKAEEARRKAAINAAKRTRAADLKAIKEAAIKEARGKKEALLCLPEIKKDIEKAVRRGETRITSFCPDIAMSHVARELSKDGFAVCTKEVRMSDDCWSDVLVISWE